ncbi:hypothetical protein [uncultured Pelagimonas sp.]|uniref:hypothetical protein n=1 Tax=uncultured Pelagimonas sp. TaxID=1618102 RepID=UPI00261FCAFF|nr:hypothetical protein [uncultured Pelagimonas sp.]
MSDFGTVDQSEYDMSEPIMGMRSFQLWNAVLNSALADAVYQVCRGNTMDRDVNYVVEPSRDLNEVCDLAGLDMWAFIEGAKKHIFKETGVSIYRGRPS